MINKLIKHIEQANEQNLKEGWIFDDEANKEGLEAIDQEKKQQKKRQWEEVKEFNNLLNKENLMGKDSILEYNKTPGLHIRELHKKGITGKGVNIAIIDQKLLLGHEEYKDQIKEYEERYDTHKEPQMHWAAVASLAVGKNIGVAPEANLHYFGGRYKKTFKESIFWRRPTSMTNFAEVIERITEKNRWLNLKDKIRVISISYGIIKGMPGYEKCMKAIKEAEKEWIFVVYIDDKDFAIISRDAQNDPDDFWSYFTALKKDIKKNKQEIKKWGELLKQSIENRVLIPNNSRTLASEKDEKGYRFDPKGWSSRTMPYIAWLYALCCQVQPEINKEMFLDAVKKTAEIEEIEGIKFKIINPTALIKELKNK